MLRNFGKEVEKVRAKLCAELRETLPSRQFSATITLALVDLTRTKERIRQTAHLNERRKLIHEFDRNRQAIEKGLRLLRDAPCFLRRGRGNLPELQQHVQDRVAQAR